MNSIEEIYQAYIRSYKVSTDTRNIIPGSIFFALKGANFNGNEFVSKALEQGCSYAVVDEAKFANDSRVFLVKDGLEALQDLAHYHRQQLHIPFLAITGSNGKTTTKELVSAVLNKKFKTLATKGNLNNHIGVPLTLLSIDPTIEFAVIEMGANHQKEIDFLCRITEPEYGIITNIGLAHLEGFGGPEGVRKGKGEMFDFLRSGGGAIFYNYDSDVLREMAEGLKSVSYGRAEGADVKGELLASDPFLKIRCSNPQIEIETQLVGDYNFPNVLCAIAVGDYFGVGGEEIKSAIESFFPDNSRSQLVEKNGIKIILDAYNANPSSMEAAISNFARMESHDKVLILGDMFELGDQSESEHRRILELIKEKGFKEVYLVGNNFSNVNSGYPCFADSQLCAEQLKKQDLKGKTVLIKGSRSSKMEKVYEALVH